MRLSKCISCSVTLMNILMSGKTCWSSNDECVEAVHQLLERRNLRHGLKKTKNLIGSYKRKCSAMSMNLFQAKNMRKKRK